MTTAAVEPYARYRLSGWIKTEGVQVRGGRGALLNIHNLQPVATPALTGTNDWTRVEVEFDDRGARFRPGQLPVRRLGPGHRHGLVRRPGAGADRQGGSADAQPDHRRRQARASRSRSTSTASSSSTWAAASTAASGPRCSKTASSTMPVGAKESPWKPLPAADAVSDGAGRRRSSASTRRGSSSADDAAARHRPGRAGAGRGQGLRRPDLAGRDEGLRAGAGEPGLGRRPCGSAGRDRSPASAEQFAKTPLQFKPREHLEPRAAGDRRHGQRPLQRRHRLAHARRQRPTACGPTRWPC